MAKGGTAHFEAIIVTARKDKREWVEMVGQDGLEALITALAVRGFVAKTVTTWVRSADALSPKCGWRVASCVGIK